MAVAALGIAPAAQERSTVAVPALKSMNLKTAIARIHRAGLHVTISSSFYLASNSTPFVSSQKPRAGKTVKSGTAVTLVLAQPPTVAPIATTRKIRVPSVKNLLLSAAVKRIEAAGGRFWTVNYVPPLFDANVRSLLGAYRVVDQHPAPGTRLRQRRTAGGVERITPVSLNVQTSTG